VSECDIVVGVEKEFEKGKTCCVKNLGGVLMLSRW
jgi:hypothetical protein